MSNKKKVALKDLYKVEKTFTFEDNKGNIAEVLLRVVSDNTKREAVEYGNKCKAKMLKKFKDKESDESVLLEENLNNLEVKDMIEELAIYARASSIIAVQNNLKEKDKYKDIDDVEENEEFNKEVDEKLNEIVVEYKKTIPKTEDDIREELRKARIERVLNSFFMDSYNEYVLFNAIRDIDNPDEKYFENIEQMLNNLFGTSYKNLIESYYDLELGVDEVKK